MSNTNNNWLCPNCGESNSATYAFCTACATKNPNKNADSPKSAPSDSASLLGGDLPHRESMNFDTKEKNAKPTGEAGPGWDKDLFADYGLKTNTNKTQTAAVAQEEKESSDSEITVSKARGLKDLLNNRRTRSAVILALAAIMLLLVFAPFIKISVPYGDSKYTVSLTPVEFVGLTADSVLSYNSSQLQKTQEYKRYSELARKIGRLDENSSLSSSQKRTLGEYTKIALSLQFMSADVGPKFNLILSSAFTLAYIALTVFIMLFAAIALIADFTSKVMGAESALARANKLTALLVSFVPLYLFTLLQAGHFNFGLLVGSSSAPGVALGFGGVIAFLLSCTVLAYVIWQCVDSFLTEIKIKASITSYAKIIASAIALLAVISMFLPCISVDFAANPGKRGDVKTKTYWVDSTDIYEVSQNESSYYAQISGSMTEDSIAEIANKTASKSQGVDKQIGSSMLNIVLFSAGDGIGALYTVTSIVELLTLFVILLLFKNILESVLKREAMQAQNNLPVVAIVVSLIYLVLSGAVCAVANSNLTATTAQYIFFSVGIGPVMLAVCTIALYICMKVRHIEKTLVEYDNPDVSSAPYII